MSKSVDAMAFLLLGNKGRILRDFVDLSGTDSTDRRCSPDISELSTSSHLQHTMQADNLKRPDEPLWAALFFQERSLPLSTTNRMTVSLSERTHRINL